MKSYYAVVYLLLLMAVLGVVSAQGASRLEVIKARGTFRCGVRADSLVGFSEFEAGALKEGTDSSPATFDPSPHGFFIDFCRAVAIAILGPNPQIDYIPLATISDVRRALNEDLVDLVARSTTLTLERDTAWEAAYSPIIFYDTQDVVVWNTQEDIETFSDLSGRRVCVIGSGADNSLTRLMTDYGLNTANVEGVETADEGYEALESGSCEAFTSDRHILIAKALALGIREQVTLLNISIEDSNENLVPMAEVPLALLMSQEDQKYVDVVRWVVYGLITAERYGVSQQTVSQLANSNDIHIRRLLGDEVCSVNMACEAPLSEGLGLDNPHFMVDILTEVGHYGDIYTRNLGSLEDFKERGRNSLAFIPSLQSSNPETNQGGKLFAPPFQ